MAQDMVRSCFVDCIQHPCDAVVVQRFIKGWVITLAFEPILHGPESIPVYRPGATDIIVLVGII